MPVSPMRNRDGLFNQVDRVHVCSYKLRVTDHLSNWIHDCRNVEIACGYLMKHGREQKKVVPAHETNLRVPRL